MLAGRATPEATAAFADASPADARNYSNARGLTLSNVGIGTYLGEADEATDRAVEAAVRASAAAGVNVVDTAINYRAQRAERSVGRALAAMAAAGGPPRGAVFVSTKNGYVTHDAEASGGFWEQVGEQYTGPGIVGEGDISSGYHCMTPRFLEDQLDRSLANTGLECIDLLYLHNAVEGQHRDTGRGALADALASAFELYERKRRQGRIAFYGMATWECFRAEPGSAQHLSIADAASMAAEAAGGGGEHGLAFVQMPFNMHYDEALLRRNQDVGGERVCALEAARRLGIGVFASAPLMQGRLLAPGVLPEFLGIARPAARALQFVRSAPGVTAALVGQKSAAHAAENLSVMEMPPVGEAEFARLVGELVASPPRGQGQQGQG